jgi:hypothetical protein
VFPSFIDVELHKKESQPHTEKKDQTSKFKLHAGFMANDIVVPLSKRKNLKMEEKSAPQTSGEMVKKLAEKIKKKSFKISFSNHWNNIVGNPQQNSCYNVIQDWVKYYFANVDKYVKQNLNF